MEGKSTDWKKKDLEPVGNVKVLVAEDDPGHSALLKEIILGIGGFDATFVKSTEEALEVLKKAEADGMPIEFVVSDMGLNRTKEGGADPRGGLEIAKTAKTNNPAIGVTLYTGNAYMGKISAADLNEMGINEVIIKGESKEVIKDSLRASQMALRNVPSAQKK